MHHRLSPLLVPLLLLTMAPMTIAAGHDHATHPHTVTSAAAPLEVPSRGMVWDGLVPGQGPCAGGWQLDGDVPGEPPACSHGPDPTPEGVDVAAGAVPATAEEIEAAGTIACEVGDDGTSGNRVQALYLYEIGQTSRFATFVASFGAWAANIESAFADSAAAHGGGQRHVRWVHDGACNLQVLPVAVPAGDLVEFVDTRTALRALGFDDPSRKYLIWADASRYCGIATIYGDDGHASAGQNANDGRYAQYGRVDTACWGNTASTAAHELMHNLGGVQNSAPHSTGGYHCTDNADRMCYDDDGSGPVTMLSPAPCDSSWERLFDCGGDDYFNPEPPPGSYLASHWNTADSSFLFSDGASPPPSAPTPAPGAPTAVSAVGGSDGTAEIAWTDGTDATSHRIEVDREHHKNGKRQPHTTLDATGSPQTVALGAGTYWFRVVAVNATGEAASGWTGQIVVTDSSGSDGGSGGTKGGGRGKKK